MKNRIHIILLLFLSSLVFNAQAQSVFKISCEDQVFRANPNPINPNGGCESSIELKALASLGNNCTSSKKISWIVLVDLYDDGLNDYEFSSLLPSSDNQNLLSDTNNNGIPDRYVATTLDSQMMALPSFITNILDEYHSVKWEARDECGNITFCNSNFKAIDKKAPTPYCISLSSGILGEPAGLVYAVDFNRGSFDNCTPQSELITTLDGEHPIDAKLKSKHYFKGLGEVATKKEYDYGLAQLWLPEYNSSVKKYLKSGTVDINLSVWDKNYNTDFCKVTTSVSLWLNNDFNGKLKTKLGKSINNVTMALRADSIDVPDLTKVDSVYIYINLFLPFEYYLTATKNDDHRNGVTTSDLIAIYRHVESIKKLESPEELLAADVNRDHKVTYEDVILVHKLINGFIDKFPNTDSWIFIPKDHVYNDAENPFNELFEVYISEISDYKNDFIGIKMGDVNCSADPKTE